MLSPTLYNAMYKKKTSRSSDGNNSSEASLFSETDDLHVCVVEIPVFFSPRAGRMSVIQYWNSKTTASVSSKTQRVTFLLQLRLLTTQYHWKSQGFHKRALFANVF